MLGCICSSCCCLSPKVVLNCSTTWHSCEPTLLHQPHHLLDKSKMHMMFWAWPQ
jgi:hypothetical protein